MKKPLKFLERALLSTGIVLLTYAAASVLEPALYQARLERQFERESPSVIEALEPVPAPDKHGTGEPGAIFGRLEVEPLGIDVIVLEGTDDRVLRRGAGHIPGTAWPGENGNIGIAAHRDTFFRNLRRIERGDEIVLTSRNGSVRRYRVSAMRVVSPHDVHVLDDTGRPQLTLVTCYPFSYIGPAPDRFIVQGEMIRGED